MICSKTLDLFLKLTAFFVYTVCGAFIFLAIENKEQISQDEKDKLLKLTQITLSINYGVKSPEFEEILRNFTIALSPTTKSWTFRSALGFVNALVTTIGYGDITPKTRAGQALTIVYALFGIPLTVALLKTISDLVNPALRSLVCKIFPNEDENSTRVEYGVTLLIFGIATFMILIGAVVLMNLRGWTYLEGVYCWFITFTTVGFGDYVPSGSMKDAGLVSTVVQLVFLYTGLVILSSVIGSVGEILEKIKQIQQVNQQKCQGCFTRKVNRPLAGNQTPGKASSDVALSDNCNRIHPQTEDDISSIVA